MISLKRSWKKSCSRYIKIPFFKKNLATNLITYLIIAKTFKKSLRQRFTSISNVTGNILLLNRFLSKNLQLSPFEKSTSWRIWELVLQFLFKFWKIFSVIWGLWLKRRFSSVSCTWPKTSTEQTQELKSLLQTCLLLIRKILRAKTSRKYTVHNWTRKFKTDGTSIFSWLTVIRHFLTWSGTV